MKTLRILLALLLSTTCAPAQPLEGRLMPTAPSLRAALKLNRNNILVFRPTRMGKDFSLDVSHLRIGDGSVRPTEKQYIQLVVYALKPIGAGGNEIIFTDTQQIRDGTSNITDGTSNTVVFPAFKPSAVTAALPYIEQDNRVGIIAILIGLRQIGTGPVQPMALPAADTISVELNPGDGSVGLLLPAVQKVRAAAARL